MHENTFRKAAAAAGLNPYLVEIANIREQCSWIHKDIATAKEKVGAHIRGDYGMLVSINEPASVNDLTIDAENIYKASAKGTNAKGQYGIRIYGGKVQSGQKIYARAYAYYGDTLVYGDKLIEAEF